MSFAPYESCEARIRLAQAGDREAMESLVIENDRLIRFVVRKYAAYGKEYEDLYQLGRLGFVRAVEKFDFSYGTRFSTYAVPVIMGEIRRFIRDDGQMHVSRTIRENACACTKYIRDTQNETGQSPNVMEIAHGTGLSREDVVLALGAGAPVKSLTERAGSEDGRLLQDTIGENPFERVEKNLLVKAFLKSLDGKERQLIVLRYFERLTQSKTAEILGLTQVQVSRLEKKILLRFRKDAV